MTSVLSRNLEKRWWPPMKTSFYPLLFPLFPFFPISYTNKETELNLTASAMASSSMAVSLSLSYSPFCPRQTPPPRRSVHLAPLSSMAASLKLSSSHCISSFGLAVLPRKLSSISPSPSGGSRTRSLTIVSAKGYKMKTHKVIYVLSLAQFRFLPFSPVSVWFAR